MMLAKWANGATGVRRLLGASSARVVLAMSASSMLTLVVADPMAYQAHSARQDSPTAVTQTTTVPPSVLGTSTMVTTTEEAGAVSTTTSTPTTTAPGTPPSSTTTVVGAPSGERPPTTVPGGSPTVTTTSVPWFVSPAPPASPTTVPSGPPTTDVPPPPTTATPPTTAAPDPQPSSDGLYFSILAVLQPAQPLQDARLVLPTFVFADVPDVGQVQFSLDGKVTANEFAAPWELFGGLPLVPALLEPGAHTVQADITMLDGSVATRVAVFTVG
ncbi:hypothetical protein BH10ACT3_BH10ACT3_03110 [soil metagenome]